jgi:hypothetical protein
MIYSKELTERSPLRVFERSIHGGLGKGNLGVVFSRAGVGKTAFLIGVALDDLIQGRKVLHMAIDDNVEHVRQFYTEVFNELAESTEMVDRGATHLRVERNRYIHTYRGGTFSIEKVREDLAFLEERQQFHPVLLIIDGYPGFERDASEAETVIAELAELRQLAQEAQVEVWLSALSHRHDQELDERGVPQRIARADEQISVLVSLEPMASHIKLRLLKDHENEDIADLHLELDPTSLLLKWV